MKKNLVVRIVIGLLFLLVIGYLVFNDNGFIKFMKLKNEIHELQIRIDSADQKLKSLQQEIDSLQTSQEKIEKVARERYDMKFPDENVIKIDEN
ncbi:MAG: septum formation initiator family protein [Melioribacteraceae bacterium]|jgi:cell division protein FtsL|nr:septum formation initiator family protein [Melioribacteraceae bacterium]